MSATIHLVGRLGRDPETKQVGEQTKCSFSVAVDRKIKEGGEWIKTTDWFNCEVWGKQGEIAQRYLAKGRQVAVHGKLEPRTYSGNDGPKTSLDVRVDGFDLIGGREENEGGERRDVAPRQEPRREAPRGGGKPKSRDEWEDALGDDVPFALQLKPVAGLRDSVV